MSDIFEHIRSLADQVEAENPDDASDLRYYSEQMEEALKQKVIAPAMHDIVNCAARIQVIAEKHES